jgi:stage IV sporulation protein FB
MTDFLTWSPLGLGRWFGTTVRVHVLLIIFVVFELLTKAISLWADKGNLRDLPATACWLGLLLVALALHELGHAATAAWLDTDQEEVHLWPLGSLVGPTFGPRSSEHSLVALAGPVTSGAFFVVAAVGVNVFGGAQFVWNPLGNTGDLGAPRLAGGDLATPLSPVWVAGWFGYLNYVLFLTNLIPALPFDAGRWLRSYLSSTSIVSPRESIAAPWTAHTCALLLGLIGLVWLLSGRPQGLTLLTLAVLIELFVRIEARMMDEGVFLEDGAFGYDFTEGYTSLESGAPRVRPYRESALKRWRRRRSELRRQRRLTREAAEEKRMDEILTKLHQEGRGALTYEEHRFLVRVSTRYRNRTKTRD